MRAADTVRTVAFAAKVTLCSLRAYGFSSVTKTSSSELLINLVTVSLSLRQFDSVQSNRSHYCAEVSRFYLHKKKFINKGEGAKKGMSYSRK